MIRTLLLLFVIGSIPMGSLAQGHEFAFAIGGVASPDSSTPFPTATTRSPLKIGSGIAYEGVFTQRLMNGRIISAYLEVPILGSPSRTISAINVATRDFSSIFLTPSLKLKLRPVAGITPFLSVGGGFGHFKTTLEGRQGLGVGTPVVTSFGNTTGALQFGAGADFKSPIPQLDLRAEIRDFRTPRPDLGFPTSFLDSPTQHNVFIGGGMVLHFALPGGR